MSCENIPSLLDLQKVKKHADDFGRLMGTGIGASTNEVTGQVRPTFNKVMDGINSEFDQQMLDLESEFNQHIAGMAFTRVGTFKSGATLDDLREVLLWDVADGGDGHEYGWVGSFPKTVAPNNTPSSTGGVGAGAWVDRSDVTLRSEISGNGGAQLIGGIGFTVAEAFTGADDTAILQAAINSAIASGHIFVKFSRDYNVTGNIWNRQEVIFVGSHSITGAGSYRMRIVRGDERSMPILDGISAKQLPKFSSRSYPVVVVVGDSISTYEPNSLDRVSSQYSCIVDKIKRDNPDKTPIFYNRAIGGQMFTGLDTVPTGFADWYTNQSTPWLDYVSALNPDLVIVSMGMNDGRNISLSALNSVVNKIKAFPTKPDLIMVTPAVPSTNGGGSHDSGYGSKSAQEGRDIAAGFIRSLCAKKKIPCLDVNRVFNVMRDGFDILDSYNVRLIGAASTNGAFRSPVECRNWSARFSLPNRAAYNINGNPLSLKVGVGDADAVFIGVHTDNTLKLTCYNSAGWEVFLVPSQIIPDTPHKLQVEVYNQKVRVYVSTTETDKFPDWVNLYLGSGLYYPAIGGFGYTTGGLTSLDYFNYGKHVRYMPSLTNSQMWGVGDGTANTKLPYGGNGVNHLTTMGIAIFTTALEACDFSMADGSFITAHPLDGGYEIKNGRIVRIWGTIIPTEVNEQIDTHITWPVTITTGKLAFIASWGVFQADLTQYNRGAQTILTCGRPDYEGVDITFHNLTLPLAGRYAAWELNIAY